MPWAQRYVEDSSVVDRHAYSYLSRLMNYSGLSSASSYRFYLIHFVSSSVMGTSVPQSLLVGVLLTAASRLICVNWSDPVLELSSSLLV